MYLYRTLLIFMLLRLKNSVCIQIISVFLVFVYPSLSMYFCILFLIRIQYCIHIHSQSPYAHQQPQIVFFVYSIFRRIFILSLFFHQRWLIDDKHKIIIGQKYQIFFSLLYASPKTYLLSTEYFVQTRVFTWFGSTKWPKKNWNKELETRMVENHKLSHTPKIMLSMYTSIHQFYFDA